MNATNKYYSLSYQHAHPTNGRRIRSAKQRSRVNRRTKMALSCAALCCLANSPAIAQVQLIDKDGWKAQMMGLISGWTGRENFNEATGRPKEDTSRVITGFNPSKLEFVVTAPESNGINVSGYFQIATSINGSKTRRMGEQIEVRAADISAATQYGTFSIGRNFAIFAALPIVNDTGSMRGVGYLCTGPDGNGPNCGHIGTGYTWTDWTAGIRYASPRIAGFQFRVGAFDPVETAFGVPGGAAPFIATADLAGRFDGTFTNFTSIGTSIETSRPELEAEITWAPNPVALSGNTSGTALVWVGGLNQHLKDISSANSTNIKGFDVGGRFTTKSPIGVFGITANYEQTHGIAEGFIGFGVKCTAAGCDAVKGTQWYVNIDYTYGGKTTFGASYGSGREDSNTTVGNGNVKRRLTMAYVQHQLTPNLNVNIELQHFKRDTDNTNTGQPAGIFPAQEKYNAAMLGAEFRF